MVCTVEHFRTRFPEFADAQLYVKPRIQLFLDDAACFIGDDESNWCGKYNMAQCYYAAHLMETLSSAEAGDSSSKAGPVSSKSAGGVSVTRAVSTRERSETDEFLSSTIYGQQYLNIRNSCFSGIAVIC